MAQKRFEVLTPWAEEVDEGGTFRYPLITSVFSLSKWQDITGQESANIPPEPNLVSLLAEADETVLDQIEADERFLVMWEEYL